MSILETPLVLVALCVMLTIHIATCFTPKLVSKILTYVNMTLHIALIYPLMYFQFDIDEAVLVYMISVFVFVGSRFAFSNIVKRREHTDDI